MQRKFGQVATRTRFGLPGRGFKRARRGGKSRFYGVLLFALLFCFAAAGADEVYRQFNYKGFDAEGKLMVEGVINLRLGESNRVEGNWTLRVRDRDKLRESGPQDGSGKISGQLENESIFLNLNPEVFGDNIYLFGKVTKANIYQIKGKWGRYGYYQGKMNEGNFEMTRKKEPKKAPKTAP